MSKFLGISGGKKLQLERLFDSESALTEQLPTGLGHANARQISFGDEIGGVGYPYHLAADGTLTINTLDNYNLKVGCEFGREGNANLSELWFYITLDGVQAGKSITYKFDREDDTHYLDFETMRYIPAGSVIKFFVARDLNSHNSGGLYQKVSSEPLLINPAPCATLRLDLFKQ